MGDDNISCLYPVKSLMSKGQQEIPGLPELALHPGNWELWDILGFDTFGT